MRTTIFILMLISSNLLFPQISPQTFIWKQSASGSESIRSRFEPPPGFERIPAEENSFAFYLRNLPLLPENSPVIDYQGNISKSADDTTVAGVVDYPVRGRKLEQCMDIILRFYAQYLRSQDRGDEIVFYLPGGYPLKWLDWRNGFRPQYHGIEFDLVKTEPRDSSRKNFERFLWHIFYRSSTQAAYFAYPDVVREQVQIGDFVVKKGKKGHAVLIVDLAVDSLGNKVALIGQGDTPACGFYLLNYKNGQPWIPLDFERDHLLLPIKKKMCWEGLRRF